MGDWKQIVGKYYEQSKGAQQFIKDVKGHIATYGAMREADKRYADPKDTFQNLNDIRQQAHDLGMTLLEADHQVHSFITQGMLLAEKNAPNEPIDTEALGKRLMHITFAIDAVAAEIGGDDDVKRRGHHKHTARNTLVKSICDSYSDRLNEFPSAGNSRFTEILEAILDPLGIPHSNLHRILRDSIPPAPQSH